MVSFRRARAKEFRPIHSDPPKFSELSPKTELFGGGNPIDASLRIGRMSCTVIGVMESKGKSTFGQDQDDFVLMPLAAFQRRVSGSKHVDQILMSVSTKRATSSVIAQVQSLMRERRHIASGTEDDFDVRDMKEIANTTEKINTDSG